MDYNFNRYSHSCRMQQKSPCNNMTNSNTGNMTNSRAASMPCSTASDMPCNTPDNAPCNTAVNVPCNMTDDRVNNAACNNTVCSNTTSTRTMGASAAYNNMPVGMCYVPWQMWGSVYDPCKALERGTMFPDLDKPFLGGCR